MPACLSVCLCLILLFFFKSASAYLICNLFMETLSSLMWLLPCLRSPSHAWLTLWVVSTDKHTFILRVMLFMCVLGKFYSPLIVLFDVHNGTSCRKGFWFFLVIVFVLRDQSVSGFAARRVSAVKVYAILHISVRIAARRTQFSLSIVERHF